MRDVVGFRDSGDIDLVDTAVPRLERILHTPLGVPEYAPEIGIDSTPWIEGETVFSADAFRAWLSAELAKRLFEVRTIEVRQGDTLSAMVSITLQGGDSSALR